MLYEGGIRVPLLVKWPGHVKRGAVSDVPIIGLDIYPTLAEIIGCNDAAQTDGVSLVPLLHGQAPASRSLYWHFPAYLQMYERDQAFEDSHDKPHFRTSPASAIRVGDWKLFEFFENGEVELYNLTEDISEKNNLAQSHPSIRDSLHRQLKKWRDEVAAPVPQEMNPEYEPMAN